MGLIAAAAVATSALAFRGASFAMPVGVGGKSSPKMSATPKGNRGARDQLKTTVEIPLEEPEEPELVKEELPEKRTPYTVSLYAHIQDDANGLNTGNREYIIDKLEAALSNTQDWIMAVEVRITVDTHLKAVAKPSTSTKAVSSLLMGIDSNAEENMEYASSKEPKRKLAPYMIEATVKMKDGGGSVILSANPKHAQATLTEAVDHMYDFLRRNMAKEKDKRIDMKRDEMAKKMETGDIENVDMATQRIDDELADLDADERARLDSEAEKMYKVVEEK